MKIKRGENYYIDLFEEPNDITKHSKKLTGTLSFTGAELIKAIVSAGMPDVYLTKNEKRNRREEIEFKTKLFETYVLSTSGKLSFDTSRKVYLDSTEVGAINYWIGMVLITVLGQKKYDYDFMVHLSMIESFSSKISTEKHPYFSTSGKITFKSPDLLAINSFNNTYGVFESKGYSDYNKKAMEQGYEQAKSIKKVNNKLPKNCLVVMTQTGTKEIRMIEKDPEGENCEINVDSVFLHLYHFLPIVELIMELKPEEYKDYMRGSLRYGDDRYIISIPLGLYKEILDLQEKFPQITGDDKESLLDEFYFIISSKEPYFADLISKNLKKRILSVE